jgi:predicted ATPase/class 3 adenylate cyclase
LPVRQAGGNEDGHVQASSGETTLLFTDIEGSTALWEREAERMSVALARHDSISRQAVESNNGLIVKMTGDGLYAAFAEPLDAVKATLMMQLALTDPAATGGIAIKLRYGLHVGPVERRDNDLFGSPVNRAARIMKAGHGGQILLSKAMAERVRDRLPPDASLIDLGEARLRDLSTPDHFYQLAHPGLRQEFPALRSLAATPNNLPQQLTSFIGRGRELVDARKHLEETRLLTLLGMGGLGKTRLALQMAADSLEKFPDGVWFVDLAPISDPALVPYETAQVLAVQEEPGKPLLQTLCAHLKDHRALLVIDNCEHLIGACGALASALLRVASGVRIIATSREALHVPGEQTYPVLPLAVPDRKAGVDALLRSDAVQLFVERARRHKPAFGLTEREAPAVAELCARLEGIPLALELAAARVRSLSVEDINKRLQDRFALLTGGSKVLLERQQTLRALVGWSFDLLQESEKTLIDRLSVFAGGFDLAAAEAVAGADPLDALEVLDLLSSLVEKSLVMVDERDEGTRYGMLETIREFARERLVASGDQSAAAARHCDYFLTLAKTARDRLQGTEQAEWIQRLEADLDNVRAAIALALAGGVDPVIAVKYIVALMRFWTLRGYMTEGRKIVRAALALPATREHALAHAFALYVGGVLAADQSDHPEAKAMLAECVELRRPLDTPRESAAALSALASIHLKDGDSERARACAQEALEIFRTLEDRIGEGIALLNLGEIYEQLEAYGPAQEHFEQCLVIARELDHKELESDCECNLGDIALANGDARAARARFTRARDLAQQAQDKRSGAVALWRLGRVDGAEGDRGQARLRLAEALRAFGSFELNGEALDCLEDFAELLHAEGRPEFAANAYSAAHHVREALLLPRAISRRDLWTKRLATTRAALGDAAFDTAWNAGKSWKLADAIERVLAEEPAIAG